jgi:hypothetical protein
MNAPSAQIAHRRAVQILVAAWEVRSSSGNRAIYSRSARCGRGRFLDARHSGLRSHRLRFFLSRSPGRRASTNRSDDHIRTPHDYPTRYNYNEHNHYHKFDNDIDFDDHNEFDQHHGACADDHAGAAGEP